MKPTSESRAKPRPRWRYRVAALLGFLLVSDLAAADRSTATSTYSGGPCELSLISIAPRPGMLELRLTLGGATGARESKFTLRENFYLNGQGSPLVAAYAPGGKENLAKQPHFGAHVGAVVMIGNLRAAQAQTRLERVEFELDLVEITEWETLRFEVGLEPKVFRCGPFELKVAPAADRLTIDAGAYPEFAADHEAYRARLPLDFLKPGYAAIGLKLVDAQGSSPSGWSSSSKSHSGPQSWETEVESLGYSAWRNGAIAYPVTLSLKMPKRFKTEKVRFAFDSINLDQPAAR